VNERLRRLQEIEGVSGDESRVADFVAETLAGVPDVAIRRVGDNLVVSRGRPRTAVLAHLDTVGFTLGYQRELIRIGGPAVEGGEAIRSTVDGQTLRGRVAQHGDPWRLEGADEAPPGSCWVWDSPLVQEADTLTGAYLDNRAGVWCATRVVEECADVAVAFTVGEEHSGRGAVICGRILHDELGIGQALICDVTWHDGPVRRGGGAAISLRDRFLPRRVFLQRVLSLAEASGVPYQQEIQSDGASDGAAIERSGLPIDWCFVGAPQEHSHSPHESMQWSDLEATVALYAYLVDHL
jgi:putative aminopeptidase FrvX